MSEHSEAFVGFDTSKLRNAVAIAEGGRDDEVGFFGEIDNTPEATAKLVRVPTLMASGWRWARFALPTLLAILAAAPLAAQPIEDKVQACAACHGDNGIPPDKSWPVIWGQHQGYLYLQLRDFKSGARKSDVMGPIASALERDDMLAIALYFSQKPWPNLRQARAGDAVATQALRANASVGCTGCHQAGYQGEGTQPRLAGQNADYMLKSMLDFRTRERGNNPGMSDLMKATSEDDLKALAAYLAGL